MKPVPKNLQPAALRVLIAADCLWSPVRAAPVRRDAGPGQLASPQRVAIRERQQVYRQRGLLLVGGGNNAARQSHFRQVAEMRAAGVVEIRGSGKRRGIRLTPGADSFMRALTAGYTVTESWPLLAGLAAAGGTAWEYEIVTGTADNDPNRRRTPEVTSAQLVGLENIATPLLVAGRLEAHYDTIGWTYFRVTHAGHRALQGPPPPLPDELPYDEAAAEAYSAGYLASLEDRATWTPENESEVDIPRGAGGEPFGTNPAALAELAALLPGPPVQEVLPSP